jgi:hypothetical protein
MTLIKRLETAEQGSRELDDAILEHLGFERIENPKMPGQWFWKGVKIRVTTDLSAAVALVERVLDDPGINLERIIKWDGWYANINVVDGPATSGKSLSAALALCIALLKALDAKEGV